MLNEKLEAVIKAIDDVCQLDDDVLSNADWFRLVMMAQHLEKLKAR